MSQIPLFVNSKWLEERLDDKNLRLIDATTFMEVPENEEAVAIESGKQSYEKEHIPGAVHLDLMNELSHPQSALPFTVPPRDYFVKKMTELGIGDGHWTVVYDQGTVQGGSIAVSYWASRLAWQMQYEGYDHVAILLGGLFKWKAEGRPVTAVPGKYEPAIFTGQRRSELLATKEEVKKAMQDEHVILINSLSPEDYKGESNAYARKGHIPNSANVFFAEHADKHTKIMHDDATLRKQFEQTGALDVDKKVITYCGGGLAATWTALILNKLGQKNVAVYDGSLNEWASDPTCPLLVEN